MAIARLHANMAITPIMAHAKPTASQTAAHITRNAMSQMQTILVPEVIAHLHVIPTITPTTARAKQTAYPTAVHTAHSAISRMLRQQRV